MVGIFSLSEDERLVFDVAKPHEGKQVAEELASLGHVEIRIVFLTADEGRGVNRVIPLESHIQNMPSQIIYLIADVFVLVVHEQADDVVRLVRLARSEVPGFIYEHAQCRQGSPFRI